MKDYPRLFEKAKDWALEIVENITEDDLDKQSVDSEWSVRQLLNHLTSEQLWAPELLSKKTVEEVGNKFDGDLLNGDFKNSFKKAVERSVEEFSKEENLDGEVSVSWGKIKALEYADQMLLDLVVHSWDLAASTNQKDEIDPELTQILYDEVAPKEEEIRGYGVFGSKVEVADDAPLQDKLLGILGRKRVKEESA